MVPYQCSVWWDDSSDSPQDPFPPDSVGKYVALFQECFLLQASLIQWDIYLYLPVLFDCLYVYRKSYCKGDGNISLGITWSSRGWLPLTAAFSLLEKMPWQGRSCEAAGLWWHLGEDRNTGDSPAAAASTGGIPQILTLLKWIPSVLGAGALCVY